MKTNYLLLHQRLEARIPVRKPLTNTTRRNNVRPVDISKMNNPRKSYKGKTNTSSKIIIKENYTIRFLYKLK